MSGNRSASWASTGHATQKAVSVRCPSCGWKTRRLRIIWAVFCEYGTCNRCGYIPLEPVPTLAEKRAEKARADLKGGTT